MAAVTICSDFGTPKIKKRLTYQRMKRVEGLLGKEFYPSPGMCHLFYRCLEV